MTLIHAFVLLNIHGKRPRAIQEIYFPVCRSLYLVQIQHEVDHEKQNGPGL